MGPHPNLKQAFDLSALFAGFWDPDRDPNKLSFHVLLQALMRNRRRSQSGADSHSAFGNDLGAEEGQAICGLSGTTPPNRKISPLLSGAYSFSTRSPMDELASRKRVGSNRIIHRSAVSDPGKLS